MGPKQVEPFERYAVIGDPVAHSVSPQLHESAYRQFGITHATYERIHVRRGQFDDFARNILPALDGVSVTMPHKVDAFRIADLHDSYAHLGIANTLVPVGSATGPRRRWAGFNTDIYGIAQSLRIAGVEGSERATIFGSGASALSLAVSFKDVGCTRFVLCARNPHKLKPVIELLEANRCVVEAVVEWDTPYKALTTDIVGSALSIEGAETAVEQLLGSIDRVPRIPRAVFDVLYVPDPTPFGRLFKALAALDASQSVRYATGAHMLAYQATKQVELMLGVDGARGDLMFNDAFPQLRHEMAPQSL